jgi:hypothetical protein
MRRGWQPLAALAALCVFLLPVGSASASVKSLPLPSASAYYPGSSAAHGPASDVVASTPNCGGGVSNTHIVAQYKMKRYNSNEYRTSTLYCGNSGYGYRHLEPHIGQYFGGWDNFDFSIRQVLLAPASNTYRASNDTYTHTGPIYQCFQNSHAIWTFYVVTANDQPAKIITAYGSKGKTVDSPCP